jgi:predicted nucleic acid-binding protein
MYLLDTNVVSELRKAKAGKADPNVVEWARAAEVGLLFISVITIHEIEVGVARKEQSDPRQGAVLRKWMESQVLNGFAGRILPIDERIARIAARFQVPHPHPLQDGLIAATALFHGKTVVTRNVADFALTSVKLLNPWERQSS